MDGAILRHLLPAKSKEEVEKLMNSKPRDKIAVEQVKILEDLKLRGRY